MSTSTKHTIFVARPMGEKPVTDLAGIGPALGRELKENNYDKAYKVLGQFLVLEKDEERFKKWLNGISSKADAKEKEDCFKCIQEWYRERDHSISNKAVASTAEQPKPKMEVKDGVNKQGRLTPGLSASAAAASKSTTIAPDQDKGKRIKILEKKVKDMQKQFQASGTKFNHYQEETVKQFESILEELKALRLSTGM